MRYRIVYTYSDRLAQFLISSQGSTFGCTPDVTIVMEASELRALRYAKYSPLLKRHN